MNEQSYIQPSLITNNKSNTFYEELKNSLNSCNRFFFSVAFINYSGLQLLLDIFTDLEKSNIKGNKIT